MKNTIDTQIFESIINPNLVLLIKDIIKSEMTNFVDKSKDTAVYTNHLEQKIELITIKDCTKLVPGISEYTIRELINRGDVEYFRTGQGQNGKILVYKQSFLNYFINKGGDE